MQKICNYCFESKSLDQFSTDNTKHDKRNIYCVSCIREKRKIRKARNARKEICKIDEVIKVLSKKDKAWKDKLTKIFLSDKVIKNNIKIKGEWKPVDLIDYFMNKGLKKEKLKDLFY